MTSSDKYTIDSENMTGFHYVTRVSYSFISRIITCPLEEWDGFRHEDAKAPCSSREYPSKSRRYRRGKEARYRLGPTTKYWETWANTDCNSLHCSLRFSLLTFWHKGGRITRCHEEVFVAFIESAIWCRFSAAEVSEVLWNGKVKIRTGTRSTYDKHYPSVVTALKDVSVRFFFSSRFYVLL